MKAHRSDATVSGDGSVTVRGLPFEQGEDVEVIVLPLNKTIEAIEDLHPLQGSVVRYDRPFEPVVRVGDWNAA